MEPSVPGKVGKPLIPARQTNIAPREILPATHHAVSVNVATVRAVPITVTLIPQVRFVKLMWTTHTDVPGAPTAETTWE